VVELREYLERRKEQLLLAAVFIAGGLGVSWAAWELPLLWDSSVYVAMGKHLYSLGELGFWEVYRPPVLPVLLGALWRSGVPPGALRPVSYLLSAAVGLCLSEVVRRKKGRAEAAAALAVLLSSYTFFYFSANPLTGILSSGLVVATLYFVHEQRYGTAGVAAGLAFLTRFPTSTALVGVGIWMVAEAVRTGRYRELLANGSRISLTYLAVVTPYFVAAELVYGSFLEPFQTAYSVTSAAGTSYLYGLKYLQLAAEHQPLVLLAVPGVAIALRARQSFDTLVLASLATMYGFFSYFPLKTHRYTLVFLPLLAYFAGSGAVQLGQRLEQRLPIERRQLGAVAVAAGAVAVAFSGYAVYQQFDYHAPVQAEFFDQVSGLEGPVASNDPRVNVYGNFEYVAVPPARLEGVWAQRERAEYFAINSCQWYCSNVEGDCRGTIKRFEQNLTSLERIYQDNSTRCEYSVYRTE
jgi:hypothetical protein